MTAPPRQWRILVSGVGSAGERHVRNLLTLGQDEIAVHRTCALPFRTLDRDFRSFVDLGQAFAEWRPDIVFATGPTSLHLAVAIAAAEAGCHVFVEKPLAHSVDGIERLARALERSGRSLMVGYMLRFHPLLGRVRDWLADGTLGRPLYWRSIWAEYLPDWHPWEDYRQGYAARRDLGGGPALTYSHDIDLALWLFGAVGQACALPMPESPLRMEFAPGVDLLLRHASGVLASLHLDFYQRPPQRSYEIVGTRGRAVLDYYGGRLTRYASPDDDAVTPRELDVSTPSEVVEVQLGWDRNDMFIAELGYFFDCLEHGRQPEPGLEDGVAAVRLALALCDGGTLPLRDADAAVHGESPMQAAGDDATRAAGGTGTPVPAGARSRVS
jgi:predicted dehydrogenase